MLFTTETLRTPRLHRVGNYSSRGITNVGYDAHITRKDAWTDEDGPE